MKREHLSLSDILIEYLIDEVASLPILLSQAQERWLGIHIQAAQKYISYCNENGSNQDFIKAQSLYQHLLGLYTDLEHAYSYAEQIFPPRVESLIAETLRARNDIFSLRFSILHRHILKANRIETEQVRQQVLSVLYDFLESLSLFSDEILNDLLSFTQEYGCLPDNTEFMEVTQNYVTTFISRSIVLERLTWAQTNLVLGYLRYVMRSARLFIGQGLDYLDLVQEGFTGLMKAAEKYNYREMSRFPIYASTWIWQRITRSIAKDSRLIHLPFHVYNNVSRLNRLRQINDRTALSEDEILWQTDLLTDNEKELIQTCHSNGKPIPTKVYERYLSAKQHLRTLASYLQPTLSLDGPMPHNIQREHLFPINSDDEPITLADILSDEDYRSYDDEIFRDTMAKVVANVLVQIPERQRKVLEWRFGFVDGEEHTLEEVGQQMGITRERVRQLQNAALTSISKVPSRRLVLKCIWDDVNEQIHDKSRRRIQLDELLANWDVSNNDHIEYLRFWLDKRLARLPGSNWHQAQIDRKGIRVEQLTQALTLRGVPSHYSEITATLNEISEETAVSEALVYNILSKTEDVFLLLGDGVFTLIEWENERKLTKEPILQFCPPGWPDLPDGEEALFESIIFAKIKLKDEFSAIQFLHRLLNWAGLSLEQPVWFLQNLLYTYYLVGLIPYTFLPRQTDCELKLVIPELSLAETRQYCLRNLTQRLMLMPEFWQMALRLMPARPSALSNIWTEVHPYGLSDSQNRLLLLSGLGAARKLQDGRYRLTNLGESMAREWSRQELEGSIRDKQLGINTIVSITHESDFVFIDI